MNLYSITPSDKLWETFIDMCFEYFQESWPQKVGSKTSKEFKTKYAQDLQEKLAQGNRGLFLFQSNGATTGFGNVYFDAQKLYVAEFYISTKYRNKKLATSFFELLKQWGKAKGTTTVYVEVNKNLKQANAFWEKQNLLLDDSGERNVYYGRL